MSSITFYPRLDDKKADGAGIKADSYVMTYLLDGKPHVLNQSGKRNPTLKDPLEIWKVEADGLKVQRHIAIESPHVLYGARGIACKEAEIGVCLIWTNPALSQMGYILPTVSHSNGASFFSFDHAFAPGEITGSLTIDAVLYIKKAATNILPNEKHLMNEAGVVVGTIDSTTFKITGNEMDFPIVEINDNTAPLWWLEANGWEDPTEDPFNEDYVCLYLNNAHPSCPKAGSKTSNEDLLIEIISTAYLMLFQEIERYDCLDRTINNVDLEPGSIAKILQYFADSCDPKLQFESTLLLQKTIRINVERMLREGGNDEVL